MSGSRIAFDGVAHTTVAQMVDEMEHRYAVGDILAAILKRAESAETSLERSRCRQDALAIERMAASIGDMVGVIQDLKG